MNLKFPGFTRGLVSLSGFVLMIRLPCSSNSLKGKYWFSSLCCKQHKQRCLLFGQMLFSDTLSSEIGGSIMRSSSKSEH